MAIGTEAGRVTRRGTTVALWRLAWRNLWRQRRRTQLLVVVVAYATLAIIFLWGFIDGFMNGMLASQGRLVAAPVLVTPIPYIRCRRWRRSSAPPWRSPASATWRHGSSSAPCCARPTPARA